MRLLESAPSPGAAISAAAAAFRPSRDLIVSGRATVVGRLFGRRDQGTKPPDQPRSSRRARRAEAQNRVPLRGRYRVRTRGLFGVNNAGRRMHDGVSRSTGSIPVRTRMVVSWGVSTQSDTQGCRRPLVNQQECLNRLLVPAVGAVTRRRLQRRHRSRQRLDRAPPPHRPRLPQPRQLPPTDAAGRRRTSQPRPQVRRALSPVVPGHGTVRSSSNGHVARGGRRGAGPSRVDESLRRDMRGNDRV